MTDEILSHPQVHKGKGSHIFKLRERMEELRIFYQHGVVAALYDALALAREAGDQIPEWVLDGASAIIGDRLKYGKTKGKGAAGNEQSEYRNNAMHFYRWLAVRTARAESNCTYVQAYGQVSDKLKGTFAEGGEEAIKNSYELVQKRLKDPAHCMEYYIATVDARRLTGTLLYKG